MSCPSAPLTGIEVVITRPVDSAGPLVRRVRAMGGIPRRLPGLSLRAMPAEAARAAWQAAQGCELLLFTSPAAVRHAIALAPLDSAARVLAVGRGTRDVLWRAGCTGVQSPPAGHERSEGLLTHPWLQQVDGMRIGLVTAPGGRDIMERALARLGAHIVRADVYRRVPPRLTRRHQAMVQALTPDALVLLSSAQALDHLLAALEAPARQRLLSCRMVVSSERLADHVRQAGCERIVRAASAAPADLVDAGMQAVHEAASCSMAVTPHSG